MAASNSILSTRQYAFGYTIHAIHVLDTNVLQRNSLCIRDWLLATSSVRFTPLQNGKLFLLTMCFFRFVWHWSIIKLMLHRHRYRLPRAFLPWTSFVRSNMLIYGERMPIADLITGISGPSGNERQAKNWRRRRGHRATSCAAEFRAFHHQFHYYVD